MQPPHAAGMVSRRVSMTQPGATAPCTLLPALTHLEDGAGHALIGGDGGTHGGTGINVVKPRNHVWGRGRQKVAGGRVS